MKLKNIILFLVLAVLMVAPGLAVARQVHDLPCAYCHKASAVLDSVTTNVCLDCHSTGMNASYPLVRSAPLSVSVGTAVFSVGDASNAMGNGASPVDQTSHNWGASDTNPAAGATAPSNPLFYGRANYAGANVSCARCHDPHGFKDNDRGVGTANPLLLKLGPNSQDAMCLDCHKSWDKKSATNPNAWLTHPLESNYSTYVDNVRFKAFTPDGGMTLDATGGMTCTTCHGTHYTDSDASTVDGAGKVLNPNGFSDGRMLKGNGPLSNKNSLCQSCHLYQAHGPTSKVGCLDCHSGHSYDPANPGSPNYFVLRSSVTNVALPVNSPAGVGTGNVAGLNYKTPTADWFNGVGSGYCQNCHTIPVDGTGKHNGLATGGAAQCSTCHGHSNTNGSFGGSCNTCHGYAPSAITPGGPNGYAVNGTNNYSTSGVYKAEDATPHAAHANAGGYGFSCDKCHPAGSATASHAGHNSGSFQEVDFGTVAGLARTKGMLPVYNPAGTIGTDKGTCSAVYCHSNGGARAAAPVVANPGAWQNGSTTYAIAPTACNACHGNDVVTMGAGDKADSPTHIKHLAKGYSCSVCHKNTADSATVLAAGAIGGNHVNGTADVVFDGTSMTKFNAVPGVYGTDGTCQNLYCHSAGPSATVSVIPDWDLATTGACGTCHQVNATGDTGAALPDAHNTHVFSANGPKLACTICHNNNGSGVNHVDGFPSMVANLQTLVCDACHGATTAGTGVDAEPVWNTPTSVNCRTCHQGTLANFAIAAGPVAPAKDAFDTKGHGKAGLTGAPDCTGCHDTTLGQHFNGISGDPQLTAGAIANTAFCQTCHATSVHYANTQTAGGLSTDGVDCATCHNPHGDGMGTNTDAMINGTIGTRTVNNFISKTARSSYWQADNTGVCQVCHDPSEVIHFNRITNENATHFPTSGVCTSCHKHSDTPIFQPNANSCGACHDALLLTEPHLSHVNKNTFNTKIEDDRSECILCHGAGVASYTTGISGNHRNGTINVDAAIGFQGNLTCTSACHASTVSDGNWGDVNGLNCNSCHGNPPANGAHDKHILAGLNCTNCHGSVDLAGTHPLTHIDDVVSTALLTETDSQILTDMGTALPDEATVNDQAFNGGVNSFVDVTNTCSNTACHNPSNDSHSAQWGVSVASCTLCHRNDVASGSAMVSGSHTQHVNNAAIIGDNFTCDNCHVANGANTAHRNGTLEVLATLNYNGETGIPSTGVGSCNSMNCHFSPGGKPGAPDSLPSSIDITPNWGTAPVGPVCTMCHSAPSAHGDHFYHWVTSRISLGLECASCHYDTVASNTSIKAGGKHLNGSMTDFVASGANVKFNGANVVVTYNSATPSSSCTASCHALNPQVWAQPSSCEACHGGVGGHITNTAVSHDTHINLTGGIEADTSECQTCHGVAVATYTYTASGTHQNGTLNFATGIADGDADGNTVTTPKDFTCTNACHATALADGKWDDANGLNCTACHNQNGSNDGVMANAAPGASHVGHLADGMACADCHGAGDVAGTTPLTHNHSKDLTNDATKLTTRGKGAAAINPTGLDINVDDSAWNAGGGSTWFNSTVTTDAGNTCSNVACHNPSSDAGRKVDWDVDVADCKTCHGDANVVGGTNMATGSHTRHLDATAKFGLTIDCSRCHPNNVSNAHFIASTNPTVAKQAVQFGGSVISGAGVGNAQYSGDVGLPNSAVAAGLQYGTCGTSACHNNGMGGTPVATYTWGTPVATDCQTCHSDPPTFGRHATHLGNANSYGPHNGTSTWTCGDCHDANSATSQATQTMTGRTNHINGSINFNDGNAIVDHGGIFGAGGDITANTTITSCNNCHGGLTAANLAKVQWTTTNRLACESCHGDYAVANSAFNATGVAAPAEAGTPYKANGHGKPTTPASAIGGSKAVNQACTACHDNTSAHITGTLGDSTRLQVISGKNFAVDPNGFCNACHTGLANSNLHYANSKTPGGTSNDGLTCVTCHDQHGQNGGQDAMIASTIQTHPVAGFTDRTLRASYANASFNGVCQVCHDPAAPDSVQHFNRTTNETTHNSGVCTTCHKHTDATIFAPSGCNGCHGGGTVGTVASNYWPDSSNANLENTAGRHAKHMTQLAARQYGLTLTGLLNDAGSDAKQKALCAFCHTTPGADFDHGNPANLPAEVNSMYQLWDGAADNAVYNAALDTCSSVNCHNSQTTLDNTFGWYDAGTSTCTMCHTPGAAGANPTTGLHTVTQAGVTVHDATLGAGCTECHNAMPAQGNGVGNTHINGSFAVDSAVNTPAERGISVAGNITSFTEAAVGTSDSCASNCHSDAGNWQRLWSTTADSTATALGSARCDVCHGQLNNWRAGMSVNHNLPKINDGTHTDCTQCHVAPNTPYSFATMHENGTVEINNNTAMSYNTTSGTCSVVACHGAITPTHGPGASTIFTENLLNGPGASCNSCHLATGGSANTNTVGLYTFKNRTGAHAKHVLSAATAYGSTAISTSAGSYNYGCGVCHPTNEGLNHQNGTVDLLLDPTSAPGTIKALNGAAAAYNGSTCTAVYCHGDGVTPGTSPNFLTGAFTNPNGDYCQNCHGNQPSTSSHAKHVVGIHYDDIYTGTSGLLTDGAASNAGHGDVTTAISITCALCHNATVNNWYNGNNTACVSCHGTLGVATNKTVLASVDLDKTLHVNGVKNVVFAPVDPIRSKAQIRELTPGEPELYNNWQRLNGYKVGATSHDETKVAAPLTAANWNGATKNCTVACHNGNVATWGTTNVSCNACHTQLPK